MSGAAINISEYIQPGDFVHLMVKDGQVVSMYRALRTGETSSERNGEIN